jgi:hypothetical protein
MESGVELFRLYQRKSSSGRTYFIGRLGNARIAVLKDNDASVDETTLGVWRVMVQERDQDRVSNRNDRQPSSPAKPIAERPPARANARPASAKRSLAVATQQAIDDVNNRYRSPLNDDVPHDL